MSSEVTTPAEGRSWGAASLRAASPANVDANRNNIIYLVRVISQPISVNSANIAPLIQDNFVPANYVVDEDTGRTRALTSEERLAQNSGNGPLRIQFMGRIVKSQGDGRLVGPHSFLRNPCTLRMGTSTERIMKLISKHTKFVSKASYAGDVPKIGDLVQVTLARSDFDSPNLKVAYFDEIIDATDSELASSSQEDGEECTSLQSIMEAAGIATNTGGSVGGIPLMSDDTPEGSTVGTAAGTGGSLAAGTGWREEYRTEYGFDPPLIADYSGEHGAQVVTNGNFPAELLGVPDSEYSQTGGILMLKDVIDDYNRLAQAFYEHFGRVLPIGQCMRCYSGGPYCQVELRIEKGTLAARPGTSQHGWAVAFDYRTTDDNGVQGFDSELYENAPTYNWENPSWARPDGSNPEAWHFESTKRNQLIRNKRSSPSS